MDISKAFVMQAKVYVSRTVSSTADRVVFAQQLFDCTPFLGNYRP